MDGWMVKDKSGSAQQGTQKIQHIELIERVR